MPDGRGKLILAVETVLSGAILDDVDITVADYTILNAARLTNCHLDGVGEHVLINNTHLVECDLTRLPVGTRVESCMLVACNIDRDVVVLSSCIVDAA